MPAERVTYNGWQRSALKECGQRVKGPTEAGRGRLEVLERVVVGEIAKE